MLYLAETGASGVQQAGFNWLSEPLCACLPSPLLLILLSSQLMKRVGQQEPDHASTQSGGATTETGGNVKHGVAGITQAIWCERLKTCCLLCVSQRHREKRSRPSRPRCEGFRPSRTAHSRMFDRGRWRAAPRHWK